jgi:hypothetical protein
MLNYVYTTMEQSFDIFVVIASSNTYVLLNEQLRHVFTLMSENKFKNELFKFILFRNAYQRNPFEAKMWNSRMSFTFTKLI